MKALHVITGLGVGGAERQLRLLLRHLPIGCDVVTLTNPGPVAAGIRADGRRVLHLGMRGNRDMSALPRLTGLIRRERYDLVHTHLYRACLYGRTAARLAGVRAVVATEHSLGDAHIEGRPLSNSARAMYLATERLGATTIAVSATVARRLREWGVPRPRIETIPNGIEAARFRFDPAARRTARNRLAIPADAFTVGAVGRLVPGKRFDALVRAVAQVPPARLLLVGDGPERAALRRLAERLGAADRVVFAGECDEERTPSADRPGVAAMLSAMDVFVSPSTEEAFGLAVLEALAAGLPVLHVTCPAVDELPEDEAPGARRVAPEPAALAAALRAHHHTWALGLPTRLPVPRAVERYDIGRSADRLMAVYERATALATADHPK
ncbi:glycosyltransferase [Streptomyces sp. OF3]|uniref:D-inositol 3-phosphate glycosyltransferase n=1 Tax=Streptomyces alkaliterrae TaxID=2213162 RepID=A0A7W3ZPT7_9ACTN|nr:glycosyltransferase [Streptomyces alkaliterrae]MBB1256001.1 glycosyltransferase [Streptomyces alkaliterrae]